MTKELKKLFLRGRVKAVPSDHQAFLQWLIQSFSDPDLDATQEWNPSSRYRI